MLAVNNAERGIYTRTTLEERCNAFGNLAATGHHIFDHDHAAPLDRRTFGQLARTVRFRLLPHKCHRHARSKSECSNQRNTAELKPSENLCIRRHEQRQAIGDPAKERRVTFEKVLVEVHVAPLSGAQEKIALQMRAFIDRTSKVTIHTRAACLLHLHCEDTAPLQALR